MWSLASRLQWPIRMSARRLRGAMDTMFSPRYLLLTNTGISVGLSGLGDLMQQRYEILRELKPKYEYTRFRDMCICGLTFGPVCHYWYLYLDYILPTRSISSVCKKIALDCCIMGPVGIICFFAVLGWLQNKPRADIVRDWSGKGIQILVADFIIWPPTEFISFRYLALRYRVFYDNAISLAFDNYYSFIMYRQDLVKAKEATMQSISDDSRVEKNSEVTQQPQNDSDCNKTINITESEELVEVINNCVSSDANDSDESDTCASRTTCYQAGLQVDNGTL